MQGPQYVVMDFSTFVCANCCGVQCEPFHLQQYMSCAYKCHKRGVNAACTDVQPSVQSPD